MVIKDSNSSQSNLTDLIKIVSRLRDPINGCPWDIKQSHKSLMKYAIEEAHEVVDAIKYGSDENLCDELGDLLLQVIIHAQIASEEKRFCFEDVALAASKKMIRRHPHVFQNKQKVNLKEVKDNWEEIKMKEQGLEKSKNLLTEQCSRKLRSKSSFSGAIYMSQRLLEKGLLLITEKLMWKEINNDLTNLKENIKNKQQTESNKNLGDLLFKIIHISNSNNLNPDESLMETNQRLIRKLKYIESNVENGSKNINI